MRRLLFAFALALSCCPALAAQEAESGSDKLSLKGPVRSVRVEHATRTTGGGKTSESPRELSSVTTYDERGAAVERASYDHRGALRSRETYGRDEHGNSVTTSYGGDGKLLRRTVSQPAGADRPGAYVVVTSGPGGELARHSIHRRMAEGRVAEQEVHDARGALIQRNVYTYDAAGRQTETTNYGADGRPREKTLWLAGGGSHSVRYHDDGSLFFEQRNEPPVFEEADSHGNWTRRSEYVTNTQKGHTRAYVQITYRTIEYHPAKKQE